MPIMGECCEWECWERGDRHCAVTGDKSPWAPADVPPPPTEFFNPWFSDPSGEKEE